MKHIYSSRNRKIPPHMSMFSRNIMSLRSHWEARPSHIHLVYRFKVFRDNALEVSHEDLDKIRVLIESKDPESWEIGHQLLKKLEEDYFSFKI